jgi:hypothetical protein
MTQSARFDINVCEKKGKNKMGMSTPPRHPIPPPAGPGVRVSPFIYPTCNSYLSLFGVLVI